MRENLVIETLYEVSIVFRKEGFINEKKVLNFIQSLTNEKKVIKSLTAFHTDILTIPKLNLQFIHQILSFFERLSSSKP